MTEAPDRETQGGKQPEAAQQVAAGRVPVIAVSLAALAVIGAATANSLPSLSGFSLPDFNQLSLPKVDSISLPDFSRFLPNFNRVAAAPPPPPAPVLVPDPVVRAGLRDVQSSQEQNAAALASLTQTTATQQADLKRITRQLALLSAQVGSLQNPAPPPLTTSSISPVSTSSASPFTTPSIPTPTTLGIPHRNPRARVIRASRRVVPPLPPLLSLPALPPPAGPVSVGGAPLSPAPAPGSDAT